MSIQLTDIVNNRGGLVSEIRRVHSIPGLPDIYRYLAIIKMGFNNNIYTFTGSGFSNNENEAKWAAIGEAVERFAARIYNPRDRKVASYKEIGKPALDPFTITRLTDYHYSKQNFYRIPSYDNTYEWVLGTNLLTNESIYLPIELVGLYYPDYPPIRENISTGLACGSSLEHAKIAALCECIERDAFMIFWLFGKINCEIDLKDNTNAQIRDLINLAFNSNLYIRIFDISSEFGARTVVAMVQAEGRAGFYTGVACGLNYDTAITKALIEGIAGYSIIFEKYYHYKMPVPKSFSEISSLEEGALFYMGGKGDWVVKEILNNGIPFIDINELDHSEVSYKDVLQKMNQYGHEAYVVDFTPSDYKKVGLNIVRVVTPTLAYLNTGVPLLESKRIKEILDNNQSITIFPHPMP